MILKERRQRHVVFERHGRSTASHGRCVYFSYDGALDPLGRSQVVPIVEGLASDGQDLTLVTFEKRTRWIEISERRAMEGRLREAGIDWVPFRYHKRPSFLATLWDLFRATAWLTWRVWTGEIRLVHARSYPPTLVAWVLCRLGGPPYIFDMRGLYAQERIDGGLWKDGSLRFRITKWLEQRFLRDASAVVTLTRASIPVIEDLERQGGGGPEPIVIPTTVDLGRFVPGTRREAHPTLAYLGSTGTWYLLDDMLKFGKVFLETIPEARLLLMVNPEIGQSVRNAVMKLELATLDHGIPTDRVEVVSEVHERIPERLAGVMATFAFIRPAPSKVASAATKISESLAMGIPVVVNQGVGDAANIAIRENVGVVVDTDHPESFEVAVRKLSVLVDTEGIEQRCRQVASQEFSLSVAIARYSRLYDVIAPREKPARPRRIVVICPFAPDLAPGQRLKFEQYYESWWLAGWSVEVRPFWSAAAWGVIYKKGDWLSKVRYLISGYIRRVFDLRAAWQADVVYLFLEAAPLGPLVFERIIRRSPGAIVYDIDDLVYLPHSSANNSFMRWLRGKEKYRSLAAMADHVIVCTRQLEAFANEVNDEVSLISSTIDTRAYVPRSKRTDAASIVIGWSGSHSTSPYLHLLDEVFRELQDKYKVTIKVIGDGAFTIPGVELSAQEWKLETEVADLQEMDIGVYPLPEAEWVLGKSGLKALQYMALGIPTVAQRIGSNLEIIDDGVNGFLVSSPEEWLAVLGDLIDDPSLRRRIGQQGRETVVERYSVAANERRYLKAIEAAVNRIAMN